MTQLKPDIKIGEGHFRECYTIKDEPALCIKMLKKNITFLQRLHLNLLRRKMNEDEYNTYNQLPASLKPYFNPIVSVTQNFVVTSRPMDYDGSHSRSVADYGKVSNTHFWKEVEKVVRLFEKHNLWFLDAFQLGSNVFVQRLSEDHWQPIIIDYKRHGWKSYPLQLNLLWDSQKKKKFFRKYHRFVESFKG